MKLSLKEMLLEDDALKKNKSLDITIRALPNLFKTLEAQIKSDKYQEALQTLKNISSAAQQAHQQLQATMQQQSVGVKQATISDEEI